MKILVDQQVSQELAARGVDASVGIFGSHHVQIGKGSPIRLDAIKSANVPSAGFTQMRQIARGQEGVRQTARDALKVLTQPGSLDAGALLGLLKAGQTHIDRLAKLNQLTPEQRADKMWIFTQAVQNLSNAELAAAYQMFSSAEMHLLQTALQREGEINPQAKDARMAAERLFDLQALILREAANRAALAQLADLRTEAPADPTLKDDALRLPKKATEAFGSAGGPVVETHEKDLAGENLGILIETAASSATHRERTAADETQSLRNRAFDDVTLKQIGDVMRSKELTINMDLDVLLDKSAIITNPDQPIDSVWSLKERGIEVKSEGYQQKRDAVERAMFPELNHTRERGRTRPVYSALNMQGSAFGAANILYGNAVIVLKPEVARRATFTVNDSFFTVAFAITPEKRANFYALVGGAPGLPDALKTALAKPDSPERKAMDAWFDQMENQCKKGVNSTGALCNERDIPAEIKDHFSKQEKSSGYQAVTGLVIRCFGDPGATRKATATHDNLEALLPHIGQANSTALADAAKQRSQGRNPNVYLINTGYIEAQIHGPIIPQRDIAEIRVNLNAETEVMDDAQRAQEIAKLKAFARTTGIRVVFVTKSLMDNEESLNELTKETKRLNAVHQDPVAIEKRRDEYLADMKGAAAERLTPSSLRGIPEGIDFALDGLALDRLTTRFLAMIERFQSAEASDTASSTKMVDEAFGEALRTVVAEKVELLKELANLAFANPEQMKAFAKWIMEAGSDLTVAQVRLIHAQATAQASVLRELLAAEPPATPESALKRLAEQQKATLEAFADQGGVDDAIAHISFTAFALLQTGEPPVDGAALAKLKDLFTADAMRSFIGQFDRIAQEPGYRELPDAHALRSLRALLACHATNLAQLTGAQPLSDPATFTLPLELIGQPMREAITVIAPATADRLNFRNPIHPAFPKPANAQALPTDAAGRRAFLVGVMEEYRQKELTTEKGRSFHGRGHIVRAYIYATAMANILAEQGVKVDLNALLCGIAGHDLARARPGKDKWEAQSGQMTVDAMSTAYGPEALGDAYKNEIIDAITGVKVTWPDGSETSVPKSPTLEAHILQSADSLDIGRVKDFDPKQFAFLQFGAKEMPENIAHLREQLAKEADLLQRLTNPLCANRDVLQQLDITAMNATGNEADKAIMDAQTLRETAEADLIAEANNADNEAFVAKVEKAIRDNPQLFPVLSRYYN